MKFLVLIFSMLSAVTYAQTAEISIPNRGVRIDGVRHFANFTLSKTEEGAVVLKETTDGVTHIFLDSTPDGFIRDNLAQIAAQIDAEELLLMCDSNGPQTCKIRVTYILRRGR